MVRETNREKAGEDLEEGVRRHEEMKKIPRVGRLESSELVCEESGL